jgi:hypothetical protein
MQTALDRILAAHIPLVVKRMREKSADYNSEGELPFEPHTVLGIKGQFADIWRKVWKLKKGLWDGTELKGEQPIEIIDDLIAHLLLTRDLLVREFLEPGALRPGRGRYIKSVTGHGYDGCPACVKAREEDPEVIV